MKILLPLLILFFYLQNDISGVYKNSDHDTIVIKKDGTFLTIAFTHLTKWWSKGTYSIQNDTIVNQTIVVLDTLRIPGREDELRLSCDSIAELIRPQANGVMVWPRCDAEQNVMTDLNSIPPKHSPIITKYLIKKDRIINIDSEIRKHFPEYDPIFIKQ